MRILPLPIPTLAAVCLLTIRPPSARATATAPTLVHSFNGYYTYLSDVHFVYHFDMGFEYWLDAGDGQGGVYLYDFASNSFFYTSPTFSFPYLYDFGSQAFLYYYPDTGNAGHYTSNPRYFYNFSTGKTITK